MIDPVRWVDSENLKYKFEQNLINFPSQLFLFVNTGCTPRGRIYKVIMDNSWKEYLSVLETLSYTRNLLR